MSTIDDRQDRLDRLAEEFTEQLRNGKRPSISDFASRYPDQADEIRDFLTSVEMVEELKVKTLASGGRSSASFDQVTLTKLDDYRIIREIGRGGMGIVLEAEHESLERRVALKVLPTRLFRDERYVERFKREAQAAARLHHPNIVPVFGVGECEGHHYYVMELVEGQGLNETIRSLRRQALTIDNHEAGTAETAATLLSGEVPTTSSNGDSMAPVHTPFRWVAEVGAQAAAGLDYAHRQGILHRDIKPANLLISDDDTVRITDFGLAKQTGSQTLTNTGDIIGTPQYMAPENFEGKSDARSDVYSLGLTLYELLTLRPAFEAESAASLLRKAAREEPTRPRKLAPKLPRDLETIALKAIARDPAHRYQTAGELHDDLRNFLENRPIQARRANAAQRVWRWGRRNPAVAALSTATLLLLATVALVSTVAYFRTEQARTELEVEYGRTEDALAGLEREHGRAEQNLRIAMDAFGDIMENVALRDATQSVIITDTAEASAESKLTPADVALLETLLAFFDRFATNNDSLELRDDAAAAQARMGDILQFLGRLDDADESYQQALVQYGTLAAEQPEDLRYVVEQARITNELAITASRRGAILQAKEGHGKARDLLEQLAIEATPANKKSSRAARFELARTLSLVASMATRAGPESAIMPVRPPAGAPQALPFSPPSLPPTGSTTLPQTGVLQEEADANRRAIKLLEALVEEVPGNFKYELALARARGDQVLLAMRRGNWPLALDAARQAIRDLERLLEKHPESPAIRYELASALCAPVFTGPEALQRVRRAQGISNELSAANKDSAEFKSLSGRVLIRLTQLQRTLGQPTPPPTIEK